MPCVWRGRHPARQSGSSGKFARCTRCASARFRTVRRNPGFASQPIGACDSIHSINSERRSLRVRCAEHSQKLERSSRSRQSTPATCKLSRRFDSTVVTECGKTGRSARRSERHAFNFRDRTETFRQCRPCHSRCNRRELYPYRGCRPRIGTPTGPDGS